MPEAFIGRLACFPGCACELALALKSWMLEFHLSGIISAMGPCASQRFLIARQELGP